MDKMRLEKRGDLGLDLYFLSFCEHMPSGGTELVRRDSADLWVCVGRSGVGIKKNSVRTTESLTEISLLNNERV